MNIQQEIETLREQRWLEDMDRVYSILQNVVQEKYDTSLEQFLTDYYPLKKKYNQSNDETQHFCSGLTE